MKMRHEDECEFNHSISKSKKNYFVSISHIQQYEFFSFFHSHNETREEMILLSIKYRDYIILFISVKYQRKNYNYNYIYI